MSTVAAALAPVFCLIALGYGLRRLQFPGEGFWAPAERLTYFILFPALLLNNLAGAELSGLPVAPMALAIGLAFSSVAVLTLLLRRTFAVDGAAFSSVFQGAVRMNTYVGLAGAVALGGNHGLTLTAVAIAVIVPLVNVLSVFVLCHFARDGRASAREVLGQVVRNPLILACMLGLLLNAGGWHLPSTITSVLGLLGRATLTIGLLAAGAGLQLRRIGEHGIVILGTSLLKLAALPTVTAFFCHLLGVQGLSATIAILFSALPTASSAYILARQMGGDSALMASILTVQTALAAFTMPLALTWLA